MSDTLLCYKPWLYKTATGLLNPQSPDLDDLVQEGYVAMWRALGTYKPSSGALPAWLTSKARWRMVEVVQKGNFTGLPSRQHGRNAVTTQTVLSLDADRGNGITLADLLPAEDVLDAVLSAYHHGEIHSAIAELTPAQRKYVYARFWCGMTSREMKEEIFGYDPSGLWNSPKNGAKHKLTGTLSSMKGMT